MKLEIREIDHVVLRVAYRPKFNMTHLRAGRSMIDLVAARRAVRRGGYPEGNQVELKGPSDGKGPPPSS